MKLFCVYRQKNQHQSPEEWSELTKQTGVWVCWGIYTQTIGTLRWLQNLEVSQACHLFSGLFVCFQAQVLWGFFYYVLGVFFPSRVIHYSFKSLCYFSAKGSLSSTLPLSLEVHIALIALISEEHFRINDYSTASPLFCRLLKIK